MAEHKRQHFIPKFFFRFFSPDKTHINLLHIKKGDIITRVAIKKQCSQDNFYGEKAVEKAFSQLENTLSTILRLCHGIKSVKELDQKNLAELMVAICFQKSRTLAERERARLFQDTFMHYHLEVSLNRDSSLSDSEKAGIRQASKDFQPNYLMGHILEIQSALMAAVGLSDMGVYILDNKTGIPYIFSDAPVIFYNQYYQKIRYTGVLGCQSPGLQIFYPISPGRCLMFMDKNKYFVIGDDSTGIIRVITDDVSHLNKMQIHNAHEVVYFHNPANADYLKRLWKSEKKNLCSNDVIVNESHSAVERKSILHSFAPLLAYSPRFSFLTHAQLDPSGQVELVRSPELTAAIKKMMDKIDKLNENSIRRNKLPRPVKFIVSCFSSILGWIQKALTVIGDVAYRMTL